MRVEPLSPAPVAIPPGSPVLVSVLRNEALRLPYLLAYYRGLGFDRFLMVDNGSTDGTRERLLAEPGVTVFAAEGSFNASHGGADWLHPLLDRWCDGRWILWVDADELLVWPGGGGIHALIARLEAKGAEGLFTMMIDMYSDRPFGRIGYRAGAPFAEAAPFFDRAPYRAIVMKAFPHRQIYGGVRERLFRQMRVPLAYAPTISKLPLLRWRRGRRFAMVTHALGEPVPLAPICGALLHFKMFDDIVEKCRVETARGEHFQGAREYRLLGTIIARSAGASFVDPAYSTRYRSPEDLVVQGLMSARAPFNR